MLRSSLTLGRLGDVDLRVHSSWGPAVPLIAYLCMRLWFPTHNAETYVALGFFAALLVVWPSSPVAGIMHRPPLPILTSDQAIDELLPTLASAAFAQLPVVRDGVVVGMFGHNDIARFWWLRGKLRFRVSDALRERKPVGLGWPEA